MSNFIPVALTWYSKGSESTKWVRWTHLPPVGTTVHLDDNTPAMFIRRYSMVPEEWPGKEAGEPVPDNWTLWHLEVWLDERMP